MRSTFDPPIGGGSQFRYTFVTAGARFAQRDYFENPVFQFINPPQMPPPRPDSPDLTECPHCGRPWVSRLAMFCPQCAYSFQLARTEARNERRFRIEITILLPVLILIAIGTYTDDLSTTYKIWVASFNQLLWTLLALQSLVVAWVWWRWWLRSGKRA